jgi:uncharacterized protein (DUF433 family)
VTVEVLERELYSVPVAAQILRVPTSTLRYWLEGHTGHPPVIRPEATGARWVTWGEFVEAGFLRTYRRAHNVPMSRLRAFIDELRAAFGVPYPLAHYRPFTATGPRLVLEAQRAASLGDTLFIETATGQVVLGGPLQQFLQEVDWSPDGDRVAERIHPQGKRSPVVIDPALSFGRPTIRGIRTEAITELLDAGEDPEEIAADFGLRTSDVRAAAAFEWRAA